MPNGWTRIGTSPDVQRVIDDPDQLTETLEDKIERCGGEFKNLFQGRHEHHKYVLFEVPEENAEAVFDCIDEALGSPAKRLNKLK